MQYLTKYECTRIIGLRALEIQHGAQHLVEVKNDKLRVDCIYIAALELQNGLLDFKINRKYPMENVQQVSSENYIVHNDVNVLIYSKENI
jgi:DNA-directed RNA polymerase subunit K/omega